MFKVENHNPELLVKSTYKRTKLVSA